MSVVLVFWPVADAIGVQSGCAQRERAVSVAAHGGQPAEAVQRECAVPLAAHGAQPAEAVWSQGGECLVSHRPLRPMCAPLSGDDGLSGGDSIERWLQVRGPCVKCREGCMCRCQCVALALTSSVHASHL